MNSSKTTAYAYTAIIPVAGTVMAFAALWASSVLA